MMAKGSLEIKCMVRNGETRPKIIDMLGGGVLVLPWYLASDTIPHHLSVNLSAKKRKARLGPELTKATLGEIDRILLT